MNTKFLSNTIASLATPTIVACVFIYFTVAVLDACNIFNGQDISFFNSIFGNDLYQKKLTVITLSINFFCIFGFLSTKLIMSNIKISKKIQMLFSSALISTLVSVLFLSVIMINKIFFPYSDNFFLPFGAYIVIIISILMAYLWFRSSKNTKHVTR